MAAAGNKIRRLQSEAAGRTNELLEISEDISRYVIGSFSQPEIFMLQSRIQSERLSRLNSSLENIRIKLEDLLTSFDETEEAEGPAGSEIRQSAGITLQIIDQTLAISNEKLLLLKEMQISAAQAEENIKAAKKLEDTAQVLKLKAALAGQTGK